MKIETLKITQEQIDEQNKDYAEGYLTDVKAGDYVYDDGEVLAGEVCVEHWYIISVSEKHKKENLAILNRLASLNSQQ
jgi:hypothetical protein